MKKLMFMTGCIAAAHFVVAQQYVFIKPTTQESLYNTEITPEAPQSPEQTRSSISDLWYAIEHDYINLALDLIAKKANIHEKNGQGLTPIEYALRYKNHKLLQALVEAERRQEEKQKEDAEERHQVVVKPRFNKPVFTDLNLVSQQENEK